jgi:hypothetical protein
VKIVPLTLREANDFVEAHHRHSARTSNDGGKFAIGLEVDGALVGAGIVGRPVARLLQKEGSTTAELLRCCVSDQAPRNATSKLNARAKRIWQLMGGIHFVSYTLKRESGASMRAIGMEIEAEVPGRQWNGSKRGDRAIADEPKLRWGQSLPPVPA